MKPMIKKDWLKLSMARLVLVNTESRNHSQCVVSRLEIIPRASSTISAGNRNKLLSVGCNITSG